jgi:hypothetical protein
MKKQLTILLLLIVSYVCKGQTISKVASGEYNISYMLSNGTAKVYSQNTITPILTTYNTMDSLVECSGAQYTSVYLDQRGKAYTVGNQYTSVITVGNDALGNEFKDNWFCRGFWQNYITIRGTDSSLWYWGVGDFMNYASGATITAPIKITSPGSRKSVSVETASFNSPGSNTHIFTLFSDGTLWDFTRGGSFPSANITPSGETVVRFGIASVYGILAETASGKLMAKGYFNGTYVGQVTHSTSWVDVTSVWAAAGAVLPIKQFGSSYEAIHFIDANDNLFGCGSDGMGAIGIGNERPNMKTASGGNGIWTVDFAINGFMMQTPVLVARKVKNLCTGTTIAFQRFFQDLGNNWYGWGRNKAFPGVRSTSLGPYAGWGGSGSYDIYPNALEIPVPRKITPLTTPYTLINFAVDDDQAPVVSAGVYQFNVTTDTSRLYGIVSQQEFTITSTTWTKISGPAGGTITTPSPTPTATPSTASTQVTNLQAGTYVYQLSATNSVGQTSTDRVEIQVAGVTNIIVTSTKFIN